MTIRPRRSVLYMPGSNVRALEKAKSLPADALILDLEDAVAPEAKAAARLSHRAEMLAILDARFSSAPRAHWYERLNARGVLVGEVRSHAEILEWAQPRVNEALVDTALDDGTPITLVSSPYQISGHAIRMTPPPAHGGQTCEIAAELGYTDDEIAAMIADRVLFAGGAS